MKSKELGALSVPRSFKPLIIEGTKISFFKEDERGKFYLMRHPQTLDFIKIHEHTYETIKMFDGTRTIDNIEKEIEKLGLPIEIPRLVDFLSKEGFIQNLSQPRREKKDEEKWYSFRIKLVTLKERHMKKLGSAFSFVETLPFKAIYIIFCAAGLIIFFVNLPFVFSVLSGMVKLELPLYAFFLGVATVFLLRILHELAHALAYSFYGGKSVEMGIEFHFLIPWAYTDTPDVYLMKDRASVMVLAAGPLLNLFFAEVFVWLFFLGFEPKILWTMIALFLHVDVLSSLVPFIRTDGYFILQVLLKFPNLLEHSMSHLREILCLILRRVSIKDYKQYLSDYSVKEKNILALYTLAFPVFVLTFICAWVILALEIGFVAIILLTPQILTGAVSDMKTYILWLFYIVTTVFMFYGIVGGLLRLFRRQS